MKIYTKTFLVLMLLAFSVTAAFAQQDGKTPPKKGDTPVVVAKDKKDGDKKEEPKRPDNKRPQ